MLRGALRQRARVGNLLAFARLFDDASKAIEQDPANASGWSVRGLANHSWLQQLGDLAMQDKSQRDLEQARRLDPDSVKRLAEQEEQQVEYPNPFGSFSEGSGLIPKLTRLGSDLTFFMMRNSTTKCLFCGMEKPWTAVKCPYCLEYQFPSMRS